jgi:hypothetical protein
MGPGVWTQGFTLVKQAFVQSILVWLFIYLLFLGSIGF